MESERPREIFLDYLDFEIEIGFGSGRTYPVAVIHSAAGEARETMYFPFDELALENQLLALENALLRSGGRHRQILSPEEQTVQKFGHALFDALFTGEVRSRYAVSRREAIQQGKGLRLKLRIQPPQLAALPWEFLYDPGQAEYVCLSSNTPIVRYLELPQPPQPITVATPLRILGMITSPRNLAVLDVEREKQRVEKATENLRARGLMQLTWMQGQTWQDLQRTVRRGTWHIFHFIGHGGFDSSADEGLIALEDEEGQAHLLRATHLGRLLTDHYPLRLVILNACEGARSSGRDIFSSTAAILVRRGIPAVLAMQYAITDQAAIELSRAFYEALTDGMPVDAAVGEARKAISLGIGSTLEWGTPVLHMRAPNGVLFRTMQTPDPTDNQSAISGGREISQQHQTSIDSRSVAQAVPVPIGEGAEILQAYPAQSIADSDKADTDAPKVKTPVSLDKSLPWGQKIKSTQVWQVSDGVTSLAFSPDGHTLALGMNASGVQLWRIADGTHQKTLDGHTGIVNSVAFSPNGLLASGSQDTTVRLWCTADGTLLHILTGHSGDVNSVTFTPDGQILASGSLSPILIRLWRVADGTLLYGLSGHAYWANCVTFSPNGEVLASGSNASRVRLWRVTDGKPLISLKGHKGSVNSVAFSPNGQIVATGSQDTTVRLWQVTDGRLLHTLEGHTAGVNSIAFSRDGQTLASGSQDSTVILWRVADGTSLNSLKQHSSWVNSIAFSADGLILATGSQDQTVRLWQVE